MVAKCFNPSCTTAFRYLADGKLFRLENDVALRESNFKTEYFWLCKSCSQTMTLSISDEGDIVPAAQSEPIHPGGDPSARNRDRGLLLARVSFARGSDQIARVRAFWADTACER
jgi:hypothetical protein